MNRMSHENRRAPRRGPHPHHRGNGRRGRARRGDVRAAILNLLAEGPMHGYQLMQTIAERSEGRWTPSPGAIYPTLSVLADEGLVQLTESDGRKLAALTDSGAAHVAENRATWPDPFQAGDAQDGPDLRTLTRELVDAVRHAAQNASGEQRERLAEILTTTKRDIYRALAGDEDTTTR